MARKNIYQTLQDWENPDHVINHGPFDCTSEDAWLGDGYYFWDTFQDLAHWWGESQHKKKYIVCKGQSNFDRQLCLDLQGEPEDMALFMSIVDVMNSENLISDKTTVNEVLQYLKNIGLFHYHAVRVVGVLSVSPTKWPQYSHKLLFNPETQHFLNLMPAIQICFYNKDCMDMKDYQIIYPEKYTTPAA